MHDVIRAIGLHGILQGQDPNPADFRCNGQQCVQSMRNVYNDGVGINKVLEAFSDRAKKKSVPELRTYYKKAQQPLSKLKLNDLVIDNHPLLNTPFGNEKKHRQVWKELFSHGKFDHSLLWPACVPYKQAKEKETNSENRHVNVNILLTFCAFLRSVNVSDQEQQITSLKCLNEPTNKRDRYVQHLGRHDS